MTCLIACLTTGKGSWIHVSNIMKIAEWEKIFLVTNKFGADKFLSEKTFEFIIIDPDASIDSIRTEVMSNIKGKIKGTEVALNLYSGSGKEHMAVISAILKSGLGLRLVESVDGELIEI